MISCALARVVQDYFDINYDNHSDQDNQNNNHYHLISKLYKLGGELGKGGFGVVYAAVRRADKLQVPGFNMIRIFQTISSVR